MFVSEYSQVLKAETTLKPVRIFRVVLLFSYQRTLCLCELVVRISDSLFILPHLVLLVKNFFKTFFKTSLETFKFQFPVFYVSYRSIAAKIMLPHLVWSVKNFFHFPDLLIPWRNLTEKEGFEPSRRY